MDMTRRDFLRTAGKAALGANLGHTAWSDIILVQSQNSPRSDTIETTGR